MKYPAGVRRWKAKERKFNQKFKLNIAKKSSRSHHTKGKLIFLLSKTNLCAVLRFLTKKILVTEAILVIDECFTRQISPRYVLNNARHRLLLTQSKVRVAEKFRLCCEKYLERTKWITKKLNSVPEKINEVKIVRTEPGLQRPGMIRRILPIKILSCKICHEKFLKQELLDEHVSKTHFSDEDSDSDGHNIDDDIDMIDVNQHLDVSFHNVDVKEDVKPFRSGRNFKCLQCSAVCSTEEILLSHIERTHPCSSSTSPRLLMNYDFHPALKPTTTVTRKRSLSSTSSSLFTTSNLSSVDAPDTDQKQKILKIDPNAKDYTCKICSTTFIERAFLNRHLITIHLSMVYKCFQCSVPFNKKLQLVRHLQTAHLKYKDEEGYIETLKDLDSVGYFQCCFCKYSSKIKDKVEEHLINEHYEDFEKNDATEESISSSPDSLEELLLPETKTLRNNNELYEELLTELVPHKNFYKLDNQGRKRKRPNDPSFPYRCARCLKRFSRSNWLKRHPCPGVGVKIPSTVVDETKNSKLSNEVNGFLKCYNKTCSQVFTNRKLYDQHVRVAH